MSLFRNAALRLSHRFALSDINNAFATAVSKPEGFVKAVIDLGAERGAVDD